VKKMQKRISEKIPNPKIIAPGLSIKVGGMNGPVVEGEFPKCEDFRKKIANQLKNE